MADALRRHEEILRAAIDSSGGYVFKTTGDAFCASFSTPSAAVEAVTSAQRSLTSEEWPTSQPLRVRMGLHSGVCEERDGDYFGPAVNRTARLTALAHGGQVLVSGATAELLFDSLAEGVALTDLGRHRLKDLGRPEHLFQLGTPDLHDRFPPLASLDNPRVPNNLPAQMTSFVGRDRRDHQPARSHRRAPARDADGGGRGGKVPPCPAAGRRDCGRPRRRRLVGGAGAPGRSRSGRRGGGGRPRLSRGAGPAAARDVGRAAPRHGPGAGHRQLRACPRRHRKPG